MIIQMLDRQNTFSFGQDRKILGTVGRYSVRNDTTILPIYPFSSERIYCLCVMPPCVIFALSTCFMSDGVMPTCVMPLCVMPTCVTPPSVTPLCIIPPCVMRLGVMPTCVMPLCVLASGVLPLCVMPSGVMPLCVMPLSVVPSGVMPICVMNCRISLLPFSFGLMYS